MKLEDIVQPTEERTQKCPCCGDDVTMVPYDIGSGPEMSCPGCEWCWGADGQDLKPLDMAEINRQIAEEFGLRPGMIGIKFEKCLECGKDIGCRWPDGEAPKNCTEHQ